MSKILHLTPTDITSDSRILKEMNCLASQGYTVSGLGVVMEEGGKRSNINPNVEIRSFGLRSRGLTWLPRTLRHMVLLLELFSKMLIPAIKYRPDIVHCHDTLALPLGAIVKLFTNSKLIYDAHELESDRNGLSRLQGTLTLLVEKCLWPYVDGLIVVSPSILAWYTRKLGPKLSSVVLNAPVYINDKQNGGSYLRDKYGIPPEQQVFIYVGILGTGRGLDLITEVFAQPDVKSHVVFLGFGPLVGQLKQLEIKFENFHVHDAVPHAQVVPIIKSADFGLCLIQNVSLSDYYCLPNKLFEYCFAGVPVLASDFPDIRSVVDEYGIGECCTPETTTVKQAVKFLASADKSFGFKDLRPLSWQAQEQKLTDLYRQLLSTTFASP